MQLYCSLGQPFAAMATLWDSPLDSLSEMRHPPGPPRPPESTIIAVVALVGSFPVVVPTIASITLESLA